MELAGKEDQVRMDMPRLQNNSPKNVVAPVPGTSPESNPGRETLKRALKWVLIGLPLGGVIWASFLPLPTWMQQALIGIVLLWFYVFFLLDTFFLGG